MQLDPDARLLHWIGRAFAKTVGPLGIAVSGGGDSMALLDLAARWAEQNDRQIMAVTVDHNLRDGSAKEAAGVAAFCASRGIAHDTLIWENWDGHGNLQAQARDTRYRLIGQWAQDHGVGKVALGHTLDDNAETFVMRLARKAGIDGLSAMQQDFARAGLQWCRPLFMASRSELRDYLTRHALQWVDDPSNEDVDFERIRVRKALSELASLGIDAPVLLHAGTAAAQARAALAHYTAQEARQQVTQQNGDLLLPARPEIPQDITRRLQSKAVQWIGQLPYPPRQTSMQHLMVGIDLEGKHTLGGCLVTKEGTQLRITREANALRDTRTPTDAIWDGRWALTGPHDAALHIARLGDAIKDCPDWRAADLPRASLMASPAIWRDDMLVAAPLAGLQNGWSAQIVADFHSYLDTH